MKTFKMFVLVAIVSLVLGSVGNLYGTHCNKDKAPVCPVCKAAIDLNKTKITTEFKGHAIYFATEACKAEFLKNPEKYAMPCCCEKTFYYCTMKECEYKTDKAGKCPKCGMELKKMEPTYSYCCTTKGCTFKADKAGKCPTCKTDLEKKAVCTCKTAKETKGCSQAAATSCSHAQQKECGHK